MSRSRISLLCVFFAILGSTAWGALPPFNSSSPNITNQYLRFDIMASPEKYTGWGGPSSNGFEVSYTNMGTESLWIPPPWGNTLPPTFINCRIVQISTGDPSDTVKIWLAQSTAGDVYVIQIQFDLDGDGALDIPLLLPIYTTGGGLLLYMPATVAAPGVIDSEVISALGYTYTITREAMDLNAGPIDLHTGWGADTYTGCLKVKTTQQEAGELPESSYEYYKSNTGLLRLASLSEASGSDRGALAWATSGWTQVENVVPVKAAVPMSGVLLYGLLSGSGMAGLPASLTPAQTHLLSHFHTDWEWWSGVAVANPSSSQAATVTLTAYDNNGVLLNVAGGGPGGVQRTVPPNGKIAELVSGLFTNLEQVTGWIKVESDIDVLSFIIYGNSVNGGIAALPSQALGEEVNLSHFHISTGQWWTGVFLLNPSSTESIDVELTCYLDGTEGIFDQRTYTLAPLCKRVDYIQNLLPDLQIGAGQKTGWVNVKASTTAKTVTAEVAAGLVFGGESWTPNRIAALAGSIPSNTLNFAMFNDRPDLTWLTGLTVVNPGDATATVNMTTYDVAGTPIDNRPAVEIGPKKRMMGFVGDLFTLGANTSGWVEMISDQPLTGLQVLIADDPATNSIGIAGMSAQPTVNTVYMIHYDAGPAYWTRYAVANSHPTNATNVTLTTYNNAGNMADVARQTLQPKGALADTVRNIFGH